MSFGKIIKQKITTFNSYKRWPSTFYLFYAMRFAVDSMAHQDYTVVECALPQVKSWHAF
jgi:hypothetical protein